MNEVAGSQLYFFFFKAIYSSLVIYSQQNGTSSKHENMNGVHDNIK